MQGKKSITGETENTGDCCSAPRIRTLGYPVLQPLVPAQLPSTLVSLFSGFNNCSVTMSPQNFVGMTYWMAVMWRTCTSSVPAIAVLVAVAIHLFDMWQSCMLGIVVVCSRPSCEYACTTSLPGKYAILQT